MGQQGMGQQQQPPMMMMNGQQGQPQQFGASPRPPMAGPPMMGGMPPQQQQQQQPFQPAGYDGMANRYPASPGYPPGMAGPPGMPQMPQPPQQQQARRLDPDQMPSAIQVMEDDMKTRSGPFATGQKGLVPPLVTTTFVTQDQGNSGPRFVRSSMYRSVSLSFLGRFGPVRP